MKKNKPPVLTSPSKIGLFVALMVVFVSIGVAYFFSRRFGITWNLLERDWLNRNEWLGIIRGEGFLFEVLPLVGLVAATSMVAYLVIAGAVRKYKRYLDSGHDYKNLLSSLKDIEDLDDKRKIERIKNHPELKKLLLGLAETVEEKERALREREAALETRLEETVKAKESALAEGISRECERLAAAFESGTVDPSAIECSNSGLRRLAEIAGRVAAHGAERSSGSDPGAPHGDLRGMKDVLQAKLREIEDELRTGREGAQEIEARIRQLVTVERAREGGVRPEEVRRHVQAIAESLGAIEQVNFTIDALSEEARGIAINTALHAGSGIGTQDDLIRLAEEVKELATRFRDAARQFAQTSSAVRSSVGALDSFSGGAGHHPDPSATPDEDLAGILSRVSLWVERTVVLTDKVSNLEQSLDVSMRSLAETDESHATDAAGGVGETDQGPAEERTEYEERKIQQTTAGEEFGFESLERSRSLFGDTHESGPARPERGRLADRRMFEDIPPEIVRPFAVPETPPEARDVAPREPEEKISGAPLEPAEQDALEAGKFPEPPAAEEPGAEDEPEETSEPKEEAVNLYALGAVDYDPALHG